MVELNTWAGLEPAVMDIKTVSGLTQVFELTLTDSAGSVVDLEGVTFRGAVNTAPLRELMCSVEGGKVLFGWSGLPAGRHSFDLLLVTGNVEKTLIRGAFVVSGRVMPPLDQESYSVNNAATLVLPDTTDGIILVELSEVGLVDLLSRKAGAFAEEARGHVSSVQELKEFIVQKVDGFECVVDTATTAITEAGKSAVESVESGRREAVQAVKGAEKTATTAITEAGKSAVESVESGRREVVLEVSNGERAISSAKDDALTAIREKQADSVLAVGRAQKTATDKIAGAQADAVSAVQAAGDGAKGTIAPLVQQVETAKKAVSDAESRINTAATNAAASATNAANSATAAQQALEAIPQVDDAGNMTLAGNITAAGGTFDGAMNANGGINIPLAVGAETDTAAVNRLYAAGLATVTEAFSPQSFLSSFTLYGNSVAVDQTVPGQMWKLRKTSADPGTVQVNLLNPFLGVSNYSGWRGFLLPAALGNTGSTSPRKMTFYLGKPGNVVKKTAAGIDMFTLSPASGPAEPFVRFIDVTFYMVNDTSTNPAGYPVRVREIVYDSTQNKWLCYETSSVIPSFNTNPSCNMFLTFQQDADKKSGKAGLWIGSNAADSRRLLCIADMHAVVDTYSWMGVGALYWDCDGTNASSYLGAMRQMTAPGNNQPNGAYAAFRALETRLIQSTSVTEFTPYE